MIVNVNEVDYEIEIIPPDLGTVEIFTPNLGYVIAEGNLETQVVVGDQDIVIQNNVFTIQIDESPSMLINPTEVINEIVVDPVVTYVSVNHVGIQGPPGSGTGGTGTSYFMTNVTTYYDSSYSYFVGDIEDGWKCNRWDTSNNKSSATGIDDKPDNLLDCQALTFQ